MEKPYEVEWLPKGLPEHIPALTVHQSKWDWLKDEIIELWSKGGALKLHIADKKELKAVQSMSCNILRGNYVAMTGRLPKNVGEMYRVNSRSRVRLDGSYDLYLYIVNLETHAVKGAE